MHTLNLFLLLLDIGFEIRFIAAPEAFPKTTGVGFLKISIVLKKAKSIITKKTSALMCVHLFGYSYEMEEVLSFCKTNKEFSKTAFRR